MKQDARFNRPITLRMKDASLYEALRVIRHRTGISFVFDGSGRHESTADLAISRQPLTVALKKLADEFQFEWERSESGILVVRKGRFEPYRMARVRFDEFADGIIDEFEKLPPDQRNRMEGRYALNGIDPALREAVVGLFRAYRDLRPGSGVDLGGGTVQFSMHKQRDGLINYAVGTTTHDGRQINLSFRRSTPR